MAYEAFLSQDEVDALLAGVTGESDEKQPAGDEAGAPRAYDLSSPERVVRRRMQTLELINERFARHMRNVLLNFMRRNADITVGAIKILKYADFERNLPVPSNLNMIQMKPLRGTALFTYDPNLVFLVIDSLFGGDGRYHTRVEGRDFTTTEQRIIRRLLNLTLESYGKSWDPVYPIEFEYVRSEMHTKFASITGNNEVVVVSPFHIEFGATGGDLNICLPYSMIEPVRARPADAPAAGHRARGSRPALGAAAAAPGAQRRHRPGGGIRPHPFEHRRADAHEDRRCAADRRARDRYRPRRRRTAHGVRLWRFQRPIRAARAKPDQLRRYRFQRGPRP